jgi:hypothetical protein
VADVDVQVHVQPQRAGEGGTAQKQQGSCAGTGLSDKPEAACAPQVFVLFSMVDSHGNTSLGKPNVGLQVRFADVASRSVPAASGHGVLPAIRGCTFNPCLYLRTILRWSFRAAKIFG